MCKGKEYIISLDPGKWELKAVGRSLDGTAEDIKHIHFRAKTIALTEDNSMDVEGEGSYKVELNGQTFIVGEQGEDSSYKSSKESELHRLCAYTAITELIEPGSKGNKIYAVLACPIMTLKNDKLKEAYKAFIKGDGLIKMTVNGLEYEFEIADITIKAEGSGITFTNPELFRGKVVGLVDIGGLNWGFSRYENGACTNSDRFADDHGTIKLIDYIAADLLPINDGNTVDYKTAEHALEVGYMNKDMAKNNESVEVIKKSKAKFFSVGLKIIERHGFDLSKLDALVFIGGTTLRLDEQILDKFPKATIPQNSQWATADGLYTIACNKYAKSKK